MSRADINNNPTNIKVPSGGLAVAQQRYNDPNVSIDPKPALDGGQFLKFSTPEAGFQATSTLLKNPIYADKTVDSAMKTWSGGGYGGDIAPSLSSKKISELQPDELDTLVKSMAKREGYTGQVSQQASQTSSKMSVADFGKLIQKKHPEYANKDPQLVGQKTLEKYPQYQSKVDMGSTVTSSQPDSNGYVNSINIPQSQQTSDQGQQSGALGTNPNDSLYGKLIDNSVTRGIEKFGSAITGGGTDVLGKDIGTLAGAGYTKAKDMLTGSNDYKNYDLSAPSPWEAIKAGVKTVAAGAGIKSVGGLLGKALYGTSALSSPAVGGAMQAFKMPLSEFKALSSAEKLNALTEALKSQNLSASDNLVLQKAITEVEPAALKELGLTPGILKTALSKVGRVTGGLIKSGITTGIGYSLGGEAQKVFHNLTN